MKIDVENLKGIALDWAMAKCWMPGGPEARWLKGIKEGDKPFFSRDWGFGGPFFEDFLDAGMLVERINTQYDGKMPKYKATPNRWTSVYMGDTPLEAACRAYVGFLLGDVIDVPQEVLDLEEVAA